MRKFMISLGCAIHFFALSAQTIEGRVIDSQKRPLAFVNIVALTPNDSVFVQGTISDKEGSFKMSVPDKDTHIVKISCIGYQTLFHNGTGALGTFILEPAVQELSDVEIRGTLPTYQLKGDRLTTLVQGSLLSKLGNMNEILERIPGVEGKDGKFTVFGKGTPLIYINGRKLYDTSELERITADEVRSVDLIRNPGAEYDASVKAVLNIRLIRKKGDGLGVNASTQWSQAHRTSHYQQLNLNYHHGKLDVFTKFSFQQWKGWQEQTNDQTIQTDTLWNIINRLQLESDINSLYTSSGFNYEFNDKHAVGAQYSGSYTLKGEGGWISDMDITADNKFQDRIHNTYTQHYRNSHRHTANAYYAGHIGLLKIDLNLDYVNNQSDKPQESIDQSQIGDDRIVTSTYTMNNQLYALKLIGSHPLGAGTLSGGYEISQTKHEDTYLNPEHLLPNSENQLKERHSAAFITYNMTIKDWRLNTGIRYEHIKNDYYINQMYSNDQSRTYNNFFPNLSISRAFNQLQTSLSYSVRTARPSYNSLSSNRQYNDRFTYQGGNPALQPTTIQDLELNLGYRWLLFTASYQYRKNAICTSIEPYGDDPNICIWIPRNIKRKQEFLILLNVSPTIGCWHPSFSTSMIYQFMDIKTDNPAQKPYHPRFYVGLNNMFSLPRQFTLNIDGMLKTQTYENKTWRPGFGSIHIGISKSFLKNEALTLQLRAFDLLKNYRNSGNNYTNTITFESWNYSDSRSITLTLRYKFNTTNNKYKGTGAGNNEKSRL